MWFWWFMLGCDLLIPVVMIVSGRLMWKRPPKEINGIIGYRTSRSMQNKETWKFAHEHSGHLWWKLGWIIILPSFLAHLPVYGSSDNMVGIVGGILVTIQVIILVVSILTTEHALKKRFDDNGNLR